MKTKRILTILNLLTFFFLLSTFSLNAQNVVITNDDTYTPASTNALLEVKPGSNDKGVLIPRLTTTERTAIATSAAADKGLLVYDSDTNSFWYYNGTAWVEIGATSSGMADADGDTKIQVEESPDEDKIRFDVAGTEVVEIDEYGNVVLMEGRLVVFNEGYAVVDIYGGFTPNTNPFLRLHDMETGGIYWEFNNGEIGDGVLTFKQGSNDRFTIDENGNVGIGIITPSQKLEVNGSIKVGNYTLPSNDGFVGQLLKTDGNGNLSWSDGNITSLWTENSGDIYRYAGNVGIGTSTPTQKLHISGTGDIYGLIESTNDEEAVLELKSGSSYKRIFYRDSDGDFGIYNGSQTQFRIDGSDGNFHLNGGDVGIFGGESDQEGIKLQTSYSDDNTSSRILFNENSNDLYGFSWLFAGSTNPTIGGTSFTLPSNTLYLLNHDNSETGDVALSVKKNSGFVGIGTTSPSQKLEVDGNIQQTDGDYMATDQIRAIDSDGLKLFDDGGNGIFLQDEGNVGIGTTSPSEKLEVNGTVKIGAYTLPSIDGATGQFLKTDGSGNVSWSDDNTLTYWTENSGNVYRSSGNVGIGTTSPTEKLHISGSGGITTLVESTNDEVALKLQSGSSYQSIWFRESDGDFGIWDGTLTRFRIAGDGHFELRGGDVGIGTTSPDTKLHIKADNDTWDSHIRLENDGTSDYASIILDDYGLKFRTFDDGDNIYFRDDDNNTNLYIEDGGNVGIGTTSPTHLLSVNGDAAKVGSNTWATFSDRRLKDVQGAYKKGLDEILKLKPVEFNYKKDNSKNLPDIITYQGFIAQEVKKVFPEAVTEGPDGYLELDINAIVVSYANAIKELNRKNEVLQKEVDKLKDLASDVEELKALIDQTAINE